MKTLGIVAVAGMSLAWAGSAGAQTAAEIIDAEELPSVEAQLMGDFGELERDPAVPLGAIQEVWDAAPPGAGVYPVQWSPTEVIRLRVREAMPVTIVFPEWETISENDVTIGDTSLFSARIGSRPNHLIVWPQYVGADAGITVTGRTSGNVYAFYVRSEGFNSRNISDLVVHVQARRPAHVPAQFVGAPPAVSAAVQDATQAVHTAAQAVGSDGGVAGEPGQGTGLHNPDYLEEIPFDPAKLQFGFSMWGDRSIAPDRVFSDGVFTYFDWGDRWDVTDLPAVYRVVDGVDTPQNVRYRGSMIIVEATGAFTLRNGQRYVCVRPVDWEPERPPAPKGTTGLGSAAGAV